ncbi:MAG: hypothetical protein Q4G03_11120 [Planctomycetia bacterium]|nr:hypothetical protein [Planctomycetia bacterium]
MDYLTKPTTRMDLRKYSKYLRQIFGVPETGAFPVLQVLEKIPDVFEGCNSEILEDHNFPLKTMARCVQHDKKRVAIEIKQSVYDGAHKRNIGAFNGFICHEICHLFLFKIGFTPIFERNYANNTIQPCRSVEWQAKALCGEVMIPYEESKGMNEQEICATYHCSKASARYRVNLDKK